jgi:hypothetical protein
MSTRSGAPATNAVTAVVEPVPEIGVAGDHGFDVDAAAHIHSADI